MYFNLFKSKLKSITNSPTIGIIAPASPESKEYIDKKISLFENLGFKIKKGKHLYDSFGYLAGNDKDRANDLNSMFEDKEVNAIVCLRGGYGSIRMAPYLDLKIIKRILYLFLILVCFTVSTCFIGYSSGCKYAMIASIIFIALYNGERGKSNEFIKYLFYIAFPLQHIILYLLAMIKWNK